jgi:hypothetical protein
MDQVKEQSLNLLYLILNNKGGKPENWENLLKLINTKNEE